MKKNRISITSLIGSVALLGGCATPGGGFLNTNVQADAGSAPVQYEQTIRTYLRSVLKESEQLD